MVTLIQVRCQRVFKAFGEVPAVVDLDLDLVPGGMLSLLGPSGCGKTTTLRLIAGFDRPDHGSISVGDQIVADPDRFVPPERRDVGVVFQEYALFPHYTVAGNVGYALGRKPDRARVAESLERVGLTKLAERYPHELSGGEQQRVALARVLLARPGVVLLDEPLSNLDAALRTQMRSELKTLLVEAGVTSVLVTHDQEEALVMADRVAVMNQGRIYQIGDPREVYMQPVNDWVAEFMGKTNRLPGTVAAGWCSSELGDLEVSFEGEGPADLLVRPEALVLRAGSGGLAARVVSTEYSGSFQVVIVESASGTLLSVKEVGHRRRDPGSRVGVEVAGPVSAMPASAVPVSGDPMALLAPRGR